MTVVELSAYFELPRRMKQELRNPFSDSYQLIVVYHGELLLHLNRFYARLFNVPLILPTNTYAYKFKELMEKNIRKLNRVSDYASSIGVSRVALNSAMIKEFEVSARLRVSSTAISKTCRFTNCKAAGQLIFGCIYIRLHFVFAFCDLRIGHCVAA